MHPKTTKLDTQHSYRMSMQNKWFDMSQPVNADGAQLPEAEISIYDQIGGFGISANDFIAGLKALGDVETINLRIASGGGSIVEGNTIYNALKRHSARVVTHIDSLAASMASVIAMAGDEIHMADNALLMIHNPWTMSMGGAEQLRKDADLLDKMEANIRTSYGRSNKSAEEIDELMAAETYFTAEEALEAGFIDAIDGANLAAANIADMETLKEFENLPQAKLDAIKMECQALQIEKARAHVILLENQIADLRDQNADLAAEIGDLNDARDTLIEAHAEEVAQAKVQTTEAIAAKAAELMAECGAPALAVEPAVNTVEPSSQKMTEDEFWEQYNAFDERGDLAGKNDFYAEHKHVIGQ